MRLNMTIIADRLDRFAPLESKQGDPLRLTLEGCQIWTDSTHEAMPTTLYAVAPGSLPPIPRKGYVNLVCLGELPREYARSPHVLHVSLPPTCSMPEVLNEILAAFSELGAWSAKLQGACLAQESIETIADIAYEQFGNNLEVYDAQDYLLAFSHAEDDPWLDKYPATNSYLPDEESRALRDDPIAGPIMFGREPGIIPAGIFPCRSLVCNIFEEEGLLARLIVDETARELRASDIALAAHVASVFKEVLLRWNALRIGSTPEFDDLIDRLVNRGLPYSPDDDRALDVLGWHPDDHFRCVTIAPRTGSMNERSMLQNVLFVQRHIPNAYCYGSPTRLLVVENTGSERGGTFDGDAISGFLERNDLLCAVSREFRGLGRIGSFFHQSWDTLEAGIASGGDGRIFHFDDHALDIMLGNACSSYAPEDFIIPQLRALIDYDRSREGDLVPTLATYVRTGMNVNLCTSLLHVHRTTFYYRLKRIEEISGLALSDYRTVLYLMIVIECIPSLREQSLA